MTTIANRIRILRGDITRLDVDAIVNAANTTLLGGGGVDGAIHRGAGPELRRYCAGLGGCPTGEARITPGFGLPAKYIIHTVGPVWHGGGHGEAALLEACYRNSFDLARDHDVATLAFPAISCGAYGYPKPAAATIAVVACWRALAQVPQFEQVTLIDFDGEMTPLYQGALDRLAGNPPNPS